MVFICLVRKSGRNTVSAIDKFSMGKKYKWQYVMAVVDVVQKSLNTLWQGKYLKSFNCS